MKKKKRWWHLNFARKAYKGIIVLGDGVKKVIEKEVLINLIINVE